MHWDRLTGSLDFNTLRGAYARGIILPTEVVEAVYERIARFGNRSVWIHLAEKEAVLAQARALESEGAEGRPLWGIPFSVKDCNDVPGMPTTNAFPPSAYVAQRTGPAVQRLLDAGALCIGKVNMDQFGIGLVGTRSPYGECSSVFNEAYISGGSSSGSGVSVAAGLVSFSVGNDAAGSGRVPAGFNNIVGVKPTPGAVSNSAVSGGGVVKTLETIAFFALTVEDGRELLKLAGGYDPADPFSKPEADSIDYREDQLPRRFRFGILSDAHLYTDGDNETAAAYEEAIGVMERIGGVPYLVDFAPFAEARNLLYDGPWIAERSLVMDSMLREHRDEIFPVTRQILSKAAEFTAQDTFRAIHRIAELKRDVRSMWDEITFLMVPTTPTSYTRKQIADDPIELNTRLGTYTNFVNLMGMCGCAAPTGFRSNGTAIGMTLLSESFRDGLVLEAARRFHAERCRDGLTLGATGARHPDA